MTIQSVLTKYQAKVYTKELVIPKYSKKEAVFNVYIHYDDEWNNGHNTFSITGQIGCFLAAGCIHDDIAEYFPELTKYIKWHLVSSDGPLYYIENTLYHARENDPDKAWVYEGERVVAGITLKPTLLTYLPLAEAQKMVSDHPNLYLELDLKTAKIANLEAARSSAIAPDATLEQLRDRQWLEDRLPGLIAEFRADIEELGFVF